MAREFRLPDIGEGLTEAEIVRWLVAEGDTVAADQAIVEVETDKAVVEIPTPYAGVVMSLGGKEGDTLEVGSVLVVIGEAGETQASASQTPPVDFEAPMSQDPEPAPEPAESRQPEAAPIVGTLSDDAEILTESTVQASSGDSAQVKALPIVRKLARDHGIDLAQVTATGPGGRITRQDVERLIGLPEAVPASEARPVPDAKPVAAEPGTDVTEAEEATEKHSATAPSRGEDERRPMSRMRRTISANMARSWAEIPHVTTFDDVDATRLIEVREALSERHGVRIPVEALVMKAVIPALVAFPEFNSTIDGEDLIFHGSHDIGIAVDTPEGLMVAVVKDAGGMGVIELASEVRRLGEGARSRSLRPDEVSGQTFTVSNIGAVGGGHGTPIVPYGTTGILSVGRAKDRPIVYQDDVVIAPVMPLSLSYDHRVIDGAVGRRFMALVLENLEEPALFLAG
jgi:pyruvate dehydrogenase E2 component (dihydrolipoamide acetyltransferase)